MESGLRPWMFVGFALLFHVLSYVFRPHRSSSISFTSTEIEMGAPPIHVSKVFQTFYHNLLLSTSFNKILIPEIYGCAAWSLLKTCTGCRWEAAGKQTSRNWFLCLGRCARWSRYILLFAVPSSYFMDHSNLVLHVESDDAAWSVYPKDIRKHSMTSL
jgi:hypothetical protein